MTTPSNRDESAAAQTYRYNVSFAVDATKEQAEGLAIAVAKAVDFQHVGAIFVSPGETFSWEVKADAE